jgi:diguanylate cyclase
MSASVLDFALAGFWTLVGLLSGCWLCRRSLLAARKSKAESRWARVFLGQLNTIACRVAADVGTHNDRVQRISDELASGDAPDGGTVLGAVAKLIAANQEMGQRLAEAETKLHEQSKEMEVHIAEARTDMLTRLANRRAFEDEAGRRLAQFARQGTPYSTVLLDVDHFKWFNDTYGHRVGDEVLRSIAVVLGRTVRSADLVSRYGGEEFVVSLPDTDIGRAREAAERFRQAIERTRIRFEGQAFSVTVSVGAAALVPGESLALLMRRTDAALYAAKRAGRNLSCWHDGREAHPVVAGHQAAPPQGPSKPMSPPPPAEARPNERAVPKDEAKAPTADPADRAPAAERIQEHDRTLFFNELRRRIAERRGGGPGLVVMLVGLDDYARFLAVRGRSAVELALRTTRLSLTAVVHDAHTVGRYNPSTYALLLPEMPVPKALVLAERIRNGAAQCILPTKRGSLEVTVSVGIADLREDDDAVRLLLRAEAALLTAQKDRCCHHNGQGTEVIDAAPADETTRAIDLSLAGDAQAVAAV